jgi:hypothetical protein
VKPIEQVIEEAADDVAAEMDRNGWVGSEEHQDEMAKVSRPILRALVAETIKRCEGIAAGHTGPGNPPETCHGYSNACREIKATLSKLAASVLEGREGE